MKQINKILLRLGCIVLGLFYCSEQTLAVGERTNSVMAKGILVRQGSASERKAVKPRNIHVEQQRIARFIPNGYKLIKKVYGDLNKDGYYLSCNALCKTFYELTHGRGGYGVFKELKEEK